MCHCVLVVLCAIIAGLADCPAFYGLLKSWISQAFEAVYLQARRRKAIVFVIASGLRPARDQLIRLFRQPVESRQGDFLL
jgi:hypothetical protein